MANNVFGQPLQPCCFEPMTGYFRDGFCRTGTGDTGTHTVCAIMTEAFLEFSQSVGNDLSTPRPGFDFPGLKPGDQWCICLTRWLQAYHEGIAPKVVLEATHKKSLELIDLTELIKFAAR